MCLYCANVFGLRLRLDVFEEMVGESSRTLRHRSVVGAVTGRDVTLHDGGEDILRRSRA